MQEFSEYLDQELRHLDYAPVMFITAKDGRNVQAVLDTSQHLFNQANERVGTGRLNAAVKQIFEERVPSTPTGRRPKIYYATQVDVAPPTIVLFVNNPKFIDASYQRFMINRFRELLPYSEVPLKLVIRGKETRERGPEDRDAHAPSLKPKRASRARTKRPSGQKKTSRSSSR